MPQNSIAKQLMREALRKPMPKRKDHKRIRRIEITVEADDRYHFSDDDIATTIKAALAGDVLSHVDHAIKVVDVKQRLNPRFKVNTSEYIGIVVERVSTHATKTPAEVARMMQKRMQAPTYVPLITVFDRRGKEHNVSVTALTVEAAKEKQHEDKISAGQSTNHAEGG